MLEFTGQLIHLRYLGLKGTSIDKLPKSLGNCHALRTLDFDIDNKVVLPTSIKKLKQLRHLRGRIFRGSPLLFEELTNLQCLKIVDISDWLQQQKGKNEFALNAFGKLLNLRVLSLYLGDHSSPLVSVEPLLNCRHLIQLRISGGIKKLPEEMHKFLPNLKYLDLRNSRLEQNPMPALEMLPNLLVLLLDSVLVGGEKIMICTATGFPQLEFLRLTNNRSGCSIKLQVEEGGMPRLRALETDDEILKESLSERLRSLPGRDSLNWDWVRELDWDFE